jgi:hypothetical protein
VPLVYTSSFISGKKMIELGTNYMTEKELTNLIRVPFGDGAFFDKATLERLPSTAVRRLHEATAHGNAARPS